MSSPSEDTFDRQRLVQQLASIVPHDEFRSNADISHQFKAKFLPLDWDKEKLRQVYKEVTTLAVANGQLLFHPGYGAGPMLKRPSAYNSSNTVDVVTLDMPEERVKFDTEVLVPQLCSLLSTTHFTSSSDAAVQFKAKFLPRTWDNSLQKQCYKEVRKSAIASGCVFQVLGAAGQMLKLTTEPTVTTTQVAVAAPVIATPPSHNEDSVATDKLLVNLESLLIADEFRPNSGISLQFKSSFLPAELDGPAKRRIFKEVLALGEQRNRIVSHTGKGGLFLKLAAPAVAPPAFPTPKQSSTAPSFSSILGEPVVTNPASTFAVESGGSSWLGGPFPPPQEEQERYEPPKVLATVETRRQQQQQQQLKHDGHFVNEQQRHTTNAQISMFCSSFSSPSSSPSSWSSPCMLSIIEAAMSSHHGLLGIQKDEHKGDDEEGEEERSEHKEEVHEVVDPAVFLNTHLPFALLAFGCAGTGKTHTLANVVENCMLHQPPYTSAPSPYMVLALHYDANPRHVNELVTLTVPCAGKGVTVRQLHVLVPISSYREAVQRYSTVPNCSVHPILFKFSQLSTANLHALLRADDNDTASLDWIMAALRTHSATQGPIISWQAFFSALGSANTISNARMQLLASMVCEAHAMQQQRLFFSISDAFAVHATATPPMFLADLTCPLLSRKEACRVLEVIVDQFHVANTLHSKLLVVDEANKYLERELQPFGLTRQVVEIVEQMRHANMRVAVAASSPMVLPPELLSLSSVCVLHRMQARNWFHALQDCLPLADADYERLCALPTGAALVYAAPWRALRRVLIRPRFTGSAGQTIHAPGSAGQTIHAPGSAGQTIHTPVTTNLWHQHHQGPFQLDQSMNALGKSLISMTSF